MVDRQPLSAKDYHWKPQPTAAKLIDQTLRRALEGSEWLRQFQERLLGKTGTRLVDWLDHVVVSDSEPFLAVGFQEVSGSTLCFQDGIFPTVRIDADVDTPQIGVKVDSVCHFSEVHGLKVEECQSKKSPTLLMNTFEVDGVHFSVVERHGTREFDPSDRHVKTEALIDDVRDSFSNRDRSYSAHEDVFADARKRFQTATKLVGRDLACDIFFQVERAFWQSRNHAARVQYQRQDALGVGWANHDHHTYRCSRQWFASLIEFLELTGFICREGFFAGADAGWGAQVLEHPQCGIVVFADVDMTADEVAGDFSHDGLTPQSDVGTVGLWCKLHGDSFASAGMHHLECQFDFDAARDQLAALGVESMAPFTDFPHLRQAFTKGEAWHVPSDRLRDLADAGIISRDDEVRFRENGVLGSHLEILERNDGYKGFNQSGISQIIRDTNPTIVDR